MKLEKFLSIVGLFLLLAANRGYTSQKDIDTLLKELKDEYGYVRRNAAEELGKRKSTAAVESLIEALKDPEEGVRVYVASALGKIKDIRAVESLIIALRDESSRVRTQVATALGNIKDARAVEPLIALLNDRDKNVRFMVIQSLGQIADPRAVKPLIAILRNKSEEAILRSWVISALEKINDPRALKSIVRALKYKDKDVQRAAISALGSKKNSIDVKLLIRLLKKSLKSKDCQGCREIISSLANIGDPKAVKILIKVFKSEHKNIYASASYALQRIGEPALEAVEKALKDKNENVRQMAESTIKWIQSSKALTTFVKEVREQKDESEKLQFLINTIIKERRDGVRTSAILKLAEIKDSTAVEYLIFLLKDEDKEARRTAVKALGKIRDSRTLEPLISTLQDKEKEVRHSVVRALGDLGEARAVKPLIAMLDEKENKHQFERPYFSRKYISSITAPNSAALALVQIGTPSVPPLIEVLKSTDTELLMNAAWALGQIGDELAVKKLKEILSMEIDRLMEEDSVTSAQTLAIIAGAYLFYIRNGRGGSEELLIKALNQYGTKKMSEIFIHCGNRKLESAARIYAQEKDLYIFKRILSEYPQWGEAKSWKE